MKKRIIDIVIAALVAAVPVFLSALLQGFGTLDMSTGATASSSLLGAGTYAVRAMSRSV